MKPIVRQENSVLSLTELLPLIILGSGLAII